MGSSPPDQFSTAYEDLLQQFADHINEAQSSYGDANRNIREEIVRCVWFGSHFPADALHTDDGRRVEVLSPGWWNVEGGPDFIKAELLLEGEGRVVGDVEVHTFASGWYSHGHHKQPEYEDVVLHVVMWDGERDEVELHSGRTVPQLTLSRFTQEDIQELVNIVDLEQEESSPEERQVPGKYCGEALNDGRLDPGWLGSFLDAAGDYRILHKARRIRELFQNHSREQLLYENLAEALGYKSNRMPFLQLTRLLPLEMLRSVVPGDADDAEKARILEAVFYGAGGFLDDLNEGATDSETAEYVCSLRHMWERLRDELDVSRMSVDHWQFGATRPVNYPTRRMAALAVLYGSYLHRGLFQKLVHLILTVTPEGRRRLDTTLRDRLSEVFCGVEHPYWSWHYTFGGKKLAKSKSLVGRQRGTSIIIDVLLPLLVAHARTEEQAELARRLHNVWRHLPRRPENAVTGRMSRVMFGDEESAREVINSARRQQGLHQLYRDFCSSPEGCSQCLLYLAAQEQKPLEVVQV